MVFVIVKYIGEPLKPTTVKSAFAMRRDPMTAESQIYLAEKRKSSSTALRGFVYRCPSFQSSKHHPTLRPRHDTPGTDLVVSVTSEQSLAISRPSQRDTLWLTALLANLNVLGLELVNL